MEPEHFILTETDWVPNNPWLPVLLYRGAMKAGGEDAAGEFVKLFAANGWKTDWRDIFYPDHHYHSTAHEALGIAAGSAELMLGGVDGVRVQVNMGDVLVLPAGVGHRGLRHSDDLLVVGAYPDGEVWDDCRHAPSMDERIRIAGLSVPDCDPVAGKGGPLERLWRDTVA